MITQEQILELAEKWEPEASSSPPSFRRATCVKCARPMTMMWHLWLHTGGFKKEIHLCEKCGHSYGMYPKLRYCGGDHCSGFHNIECDDPNHPYK